MARHCSYCGQAGHYYKTCPRPTGVKRTYTPHIIVPRHLQKDMERRQEGNRIVKRVADFLGIKEVYARQALKSLEQVSSSQSYMKK